MNNPPQTLGDVLYDSKSAVPVLEHDWVQLVWKVSIGNLDSLSALWEQAHAIVFTLAVRVTGDRAAAEEVTVGTYVDIWRHAARYQASHQPVLAWMLNLARARALAMYLPQMPNSIGSEPIDAAEDCMELMSPPPALWDTLAQLIVKQSAKGPTRPAAKSWPAPAWEEVAPGISCKLLGTDNLRNKVSMLVRLSPGVEYPSHVHAGTEELHLLHGELAIDDGTFYPGDYYRAEAGSADHRVWSRTGCMCALITSTQDQLIA